MSSFVKILKKKKNPAHLVDKPVNWNEIAEKSSICSLHSTTVVD